MVNPMKSNSYSAEHEYKTCAGLGCSSRGVHYLKIMHINKCGWFCDPCSVNLLQSELASEIENY